MLQCIMYQEAECDHASGRVTLQSRAPQLTVCGDAAWKGQKALRDVLLQTLFILQDDY